MTVLDKDLFPSGEAYHERKNYLNKVVARTFVPMAFHMCWTDNKVRASPCDTSKYYTGVRPC